MLDDSKQGPVSRDGVKSGRQGLKGRRKRKRVRSRANGSGHQSDTSSKDNNLAKSQVAPPSADLQKKTQDSIAPGETFVLKMDASTNRLTINGNSRMFGTNNVDSNNALVQEIVGVVTNGGEHDLQNLTWALATVLGIGPKDELEGLLAAQMIGVHNLAMKFLARATLEGQTFEGTDANVNRAVRLLRTFTSQMEALNRHRGKVSQQMVVENVNVNDGGQAIVGPVSDARRRKARTEDEDKSE